MRRLVLLALLTLAGGCEAPADDSAEPAAGIPDRDTNAFRADAAHDRAYAGEWAASTDNCNNQKEIWTIEENRMGVKRQRFCHFERIYASDTDTGLGWSASARCLAEGRQSNDFVFFRISSNGLQMRVTINDSDGVELVRCPMRT